MLGGYRIHNFVENSGGYAQAEYYQHRLIFGRVIGKIKSVKFFSETVYTASISTMAQSYHWCGAAN